MIEYPSQLEIEIARGFCSATCPMCSIDQTKYNKTIMKNDLFKSIIDSFGKHIYKIKHVNLVGLGEVLLDKKLHGKIIEESKGGFANIYNQIWVRK